MIVPKLQWETSQDNKLQHLKEQTIKEWPKKNDHIAQNLRPYWMFEDNMAVTDGVILKGRHVVIPDTLQKQALEQLYINNMAIEKTALLAHESESIYWPGINSDI